MARGLDVVLLASVLVVFRLLRGAAGLCDDSYCPDAFCTTGSCSCIIDKRVNDSFLENDRTFVRGPSCNITSLMCEGSTTFYCDNKGSCKQIVQGENYECVCQPGFAGKHCQLVGDPCPGSYYCYNRAACNVGSSTPCDCPGGWQGDQYCSLRTGGADGEGTEDFGGKDKDNSETQPWYVPFLSVLAGLAAVGFLGALGLRYYKRRHVGHHRFEEVQMHGGPTFYDDDDDAFTTKPLQRR